MSLKKNKLAFAIAATVAATSANAIVDLDAGTGNINFASEATVVATGTNINTTPTAVLDVAVDVGFSITGGTAKYLRLDAQSNTTFLALPTGLTINANNAARCGGAVLATLGVDIAVSQGGIGSSFVIYEVNAPVDITFSDDVCVAGQSLTTTDMAGSTLRYRLYDTAVDAANQTANQLKDVTRTYYGWASGLAASCTAGNAPQVDAVNPAFFKTAPAATDVGPYTIFTPTIAASATTVALTGLPLNVDVDYFTLGSTIVVAGDLNAWDGTPGGSSTLGTLAAAGTIATGSQSESFVTAGAETMANVSAAPGYQITANGVTAMDNNLYSMTITDTAGLATFNVGTVDLGTCGALVLSGSTDRADFALTPGGVYPNMFRVRNPGATAGAVKVTMWNDDGDSVTFDFSTVAGGTASLGARASSGLISVDDWFAAAQAADPTFTLGATDKLAIQVRGEFGDDAREGFSDAGTGSAGLVLGNVRAADGIVLQGFSLSLDNGNFFMMKD
jgi:hypothetical protein